MRARPDGAHHAGAHHDGGHPAGATTGLAAVGAVAALEWRVQRREPATLLYVLVFLLLTFGFTSSGTVELVRDREALPRLAPLAIALALGGLTAFGQVITTMVTASAFLRDLAWRTDQLLFSTPLDPRAWVLGRWLAALGVLAAVSLAMPAGVLLGALAPWSGRDVPLATVAAGVVRAWVTLTLPTIVAVGTLLAVAAVRTRRLLGVLAAALALLFLWQGSEALGRAARDGAARVGAGPAVAGRVAALADPFGTVAVQQVTAAWDDRARAIRPVPWRGPVATGRLLWLTLALALGALTLRHAEPVAARRAAGRSARPPSPAPASRATLPPRAGSVRSRWWPTVLPSGQVAALARTTLAWTWRETGWRVIGLLGALNVLAHAVTASATSPWDAAGLLLVVREHARLFLILLATIYAGEVLWRDHDARVHALVASAPVATARLVLGRVGGLAVAQGALVALLVAAAWGGRLAGLPLAALAGAEPLVATASPAAVGWWWALPVGALLWLWLPFVQWTLLSLLVHVTVRHKVIAHLLLIAGWVAAVALDANGVTAWWLRYADPPPLDANAPLPLGEAAARASWWTAVAAVALRLSVRGWPRVTSPR
jgi:ABC-2 type transport system permease protein